MAEDNSDSPTEAVPEAVQDPADNDANGAPAGSTSAMDTAGKFDVN